MLSAACKCNKKLLVAEIDAFVPGAQRTGEYFKKGHLGRFFTSVCCNHRCYFSKERPQWFLDPEKSGGGMFSNVGLHRLAVTRSCLPGQKPVSVCASVSYQKDIRVEACTSALVRYKDGGAALYEEVGYYPKVPWANNGVHFVFEEGVVGWNDTKWLMVHKDGGMTSEAIGPYRLYEPIYENLISALQGRDYSPCACHYAEDVAIVRAAYESGRTGKEVVIRECEYKMDSPYCMQREPHG
jgi:predicted dehydrogenase